MFAERPDLNSLIPDDCHFCQQEEEIHWRQWQDGIDIAQFGGRRLRHGADALVKQRQAILGDVHTRYQPLNRDLKDEREIA